jgi:hypothetical protein
MTRAGPVYGAVSNAVQGKAHRFSYRNLIIIETLGDSGHVQIMISDNDVGDFFTEVMCPRSAKFYGLMNAFAGEGVLVIVWDKVYPWG